MNLNIIDSIKIKMFQIIADNFGINHVNIIFIKNFLL
jgi:hypothetical protein